MAIHSRTLAWKIPWMEEPGGLQSMGLLRVRHDWVTSLSPFTFYALEKEMATHSSVLDWRIPGTGEPRGLVSMGSHRVGHDWCDSAKYIYGASLVAQTTKNLPTIWEIWVWCLGWEDSLEEEMAMHSSILAWTIPWAEEPAGLQSMRLQRIGHSWVTNTSVFKRIH